MGRILRSWLRDHPDDPPRFALPPKSILVIGCLDHASAVAQNAAARALVDAFCAAGCAVQPEGQPTLNMLRVVLDLARVPYAVAPADAFERYVVLGPSSGPSHTS
jgi:hypothetical protein